MKSFNQFLGESHLLEMRKEDKVKGKKKTPLYKTVVKKRIENDSDGKPKVKRHERKVLDSPAHMGRFKQGMKDPTALGPGIEMPGQVRHPHGGGGSGARKEGILRGKKKVPGEKKPRDRFKDGPTPAEKVKNRKHRIAMYNKRMYEGYDKPDERLKTDRDMFNVPKDEQEAAKARLLAKAKKMREKKKLKEESEAKSCPDGKYWCFESEKCKKIPKGYRVGRGGYLAKEEDPDDEVEINDMGEVGGLGEENIQEALPLLAPAAGLALKGLGAGLAAWSAKDAYDSAKRGDWGNAALSGLGAIPGVGLLGRGARGAKALRGAQALNKTRKGVNAAGRTNTAVRSANAANKANKANKLNKANRSAGLKRSIASNAVSGLVGGALDALKNNSSSSSSASKKYGASAKDMDAPDSRDARERYRKMLAKKKQEQQQENYNYSNWRDDFSPLEVESFDIIKAEPLTPSKGIGSDMLGEKCWPGYTKKGMKTMFGKRYPNCVKKKSK